jgi:hypothetical protein
VLTPYATYVSGRTTPVGADELGQISSGEITVKGRCMGGILRPSSHEVFHPDLDLHQGLSSMFRWFIYWPDHQDSPPYLLAQDTSSKDASNTATHTAQPGPDIRAKVLHMMVTIPCQGANQGKHHFLVQQCVDEQEKAYRRLGYLTWDDYNLELLSLLGEEEVLKII